MVRDGRYGGLLTMRAQGLVAKQEVILRARASGGLEGWLQALLQNRVAPRGLHWSV